MVRLEDLIGELTGRPVELVEKMLANQVAQGNPEDITVFQKHNDAGARNGGFDWRKSFEGLQYWNQAINYKMYASLNKGDEIKIGDTVLVESQKKKTERVVVAIIAGDFPYWTVSRQAFEGLMAGSEQHFIIQSHRTVEAAKATPAKVKLTLQDISEGKGVGIDPSLIQIVR